MEDRSTTPARESETQTTPQIAPSPLDDATNTYSKQDGETQAENSKGDGRQQRPQVSGPPIRQASNGKANGEGAEKLQASLEQDCRCHPMEGALAGSTDLPEEIQHALVKYQRAKKLLSHQIQESEKMGELLSKERTTNAELRLRLDSKLTVCEDAVKEGLSAIHTRVKNDKEHMQHLKQGLGLSEMGKMAAVKELHKCQCELKATKETLADLELVKDNLLASVEQKHKELDKLAKEEATATEARIREELHAEFSAKEHLAEKQARAEADKLRKDLEFIQENIRVRVFGMLEGLQNEACTVQEMVDQWDQWVGDLTSELSEEREKRSECREECRRLKARVDELNLKTSELQSLKNESTMLLIDKTHLIGENAKLQHRVANLENKNAHIENCWKESREQSRTAESKFLNLKRCLEEVSAADPPDDVGRELHEALEELVEVKRERNEAVAGFEQSRERQSGLEDVVRALEEELRNLSVAGQAEISALADRLESTEREATEQKMLLQSKCQSLESALALERQQHQGSSSGRRNALQGCMSDLQAASQELHSVQEGLGRMLPTTEAVKEIATHVIHQAEAVTQQLQSELNDARSNFEEVDRNFTLKKLECRNLEARLGETHRKLRIQDEVIIRQNEELHKVKEDVQTGADLAYEVVNTRERCEMLKSTIERLDREILEEREEVLMLCRANSNLQGDLTAANHALEETERKLAYHERRRRREDRPSGSSAQHSSGGRMPMPSGGPVSGLTRQGRVPGMLSPVGSLDAFSSESGHRSDRASSSTTSTDAFRPRRDNQRGPLRTGRGNESTQPAAPQVAVEDSSSSSTDVSSLFCWADLSARVTSLREEGLGNADGLGWGAVSESARSNDR
ncbi:hypothetical protein BSKO_03589 [Bryopsis sp. KO-2023]|nr:hypothetical protein BSKO_03589 [Bryopsis sp. KO-2023]